MGWDVGISGSEMFPGPLSERVDERDESTRGQVTFPSKISRGSTWGQRRPTLSDVKPMYFSLDCFLSETTCHLHYPLDIWQLQYISLLCLSIHYIHAQLTRSVGPMLGWCWPSVVNNEPTSVHHWANASCLLDTSYVTVTYISNKSFMVHFWILDEQKNIHKIVFFQD